MTSDAFASVAELLASAREVWILSHVNPDPDAYGSSCGLALALRRIGIEVSLFNESGIVPRLASIPGVSTVRKELPEEVPAETVVVVCDCGAAERVGDTYLEWLKKAPLVVNIDHHNANTEFGHFNIVVESASSTSEIIFDLLTVLEKDLGKDDIISADAAMALLGGIVGDTGSFRYASTSAKTFLAANTLVLRGARPEVIAQNLFASVSLPAVRLQAEAMTAMKIQFGGAFAEVMVTQEMLARHGAELLDSDPLVERARDIQGVLVSALFKQDADIWRVSLRARSGTVDVSAIARSFGGGGHKPAAAFRWRQDLATLQEQLRSRIREALDSLPRG